MQTGGLFKMAYQPLYATLNDGINPVHTHSLRGRVTDIDFWLNSHFGEVFRINANSDGDFTAKIKQRINDCKNKIAFFSQKNNNKKIVLWQKKLIDSEANFILNDKKEAVNININLIENPKFHFFINNSPIDANDFKLLTENKEIWAEILTKLKTLKGLENKEAGKE
jgi:hypothetical protein